jgi:prostaglandin-H2 D-isomerase / glutathione transferase
VRAWAGRPVSQSNGINRYVGKLAGLYPEDALAAALCDEAMDAVEEITVKIEPTFSMPDEEKKLARQRLADTDIPFYLQALEKRLQAQGDYFAGGKLTVADLKVFVMLRHLKSGRLDYVPGDIVDLHAPALSAFCERVRAHPAVHVYYERAGAGVA